MIEPLLTDEDYYARVESREIITNLAKAAGLATVISTTRPDIDNIYECVRNTTARAVCHSKKSWQARHTDIKILQRISVLMGCAILPHLKSLVEIIEHGKKRGFSIISGMFFVQYVLYLFECKVTVPLFTILVFGRMPKQNIFNALPDHNTTPLF